MQGKTEPSCHMPIKGQSQKLSQYIMTADKENNPIDNDVGSSPMDENCSFIESEHDVPKVISLDFNSDSEPTPSKTKTQNEDKMIKSPVISNKRRRRKKRQITEKSFLESDINESIDFINKTHFPDEEFESAMCQISTEAPDSDLLHEKIYDQRSKTDTVINNVDSNDNSDIKFNKKPKMCCKLFITKSNTSSPEISQNKKKLVQSKLVLQKVKKKSDSIFSLDNEEFNSNWDASGQKHTTPNEDLKVKSECSNTTRDDSILLTPLRSFKAKSNFSLSLKNSLSETKRDLFRISDNYVNNENKILEKNEEQNLEDNTFYVVPNPIQMPSTSNHTVKRKLSQSDEILEENSFLNDETFFSPGEKFQQSKSDNKNNIDEHSKIQVVDNKKIFNDKNNADKPFIGKTVRGKKARAQLEGWDCRECEKFYEAMGYTEEELKKIKKNCSRHRSKFNERYNTPEGFWNPVFTHPYTQPDD